MSGKMKAAVLEELGSITVKEVEVPKIDENEVLIKVKYCGICGSDVPRSMITGARKYPLILGHEFSGTVESLGKEVDHLNEGDNVAVAPLIPCGKCQYCREGNYNLCEAYNIIGTGSDGGFAEYVKAPKEHALKVPSGVDIETAAGIEPAAIGYHGVQKAAIQPGETVVIMGCGSIGQLTLQWARIFGASTIIAVDISEEKLAMAKKLGADITINGKETDAVNQINKLTNGGADVAIETAGSVMTQQQTLLSTRKKGRVVFLGITHKGLNLEEETINHMMRGEIQVNGSWNSYTAPYPGIAWNATLDFMEKKELNFKDMVSHTIHLEDLESYLRGMAEGTLEFNKVLVKFNN